ncbi:hypothetical protein ACOSQ4_031678 [Xanthoceras sorbifolium]
MKTKLIAAMVTARYKYNVSLNRLLGLLHLRPPHPAKTLNPRPELFSTMKTSSNIILGSSRMGGPLEWLVPSEIFPLEIRSAAQSINVSVNMFFNFVIAQVFLSMLCYKKFGLFIFLAFFMLIMSIFIYYFLPKTKGIPIEEMGQRKTTQAWGLEFLKSSRDVKAGVSKMEET